MADRHILGKTNSEIQELSRRGLLEDLINAPDDFEPPELTQFTRADLRTMSPAAIVEADRQGQFKNLYNPNTQEHTK